MTDRYGATAISDRIDVAVRPYRPTDHREGRHLWAELAAERARQYPLAADEGDGETARGAGFEEYLARIDLAGVWVAEDDDEGVVGLAGLVLRENAGEIWPIVVSEPYRDSGIGTALVRAVIDVARRRGMRALGVSPAVRDTAALHCLHRAGFTALASVELTLDLGRRRLDWQEGMDVAGLPFRY
ncbi:hypothetical protein GCM10010123_16610 [Pilimelia anulata]|uniref:N-acetyltransferase domain-containing protein n=1 Tax=Pilimelia anulata TaxID=53371 RepID=A0A8J3B2M3_9ACTN|nr:GNAT family N-acetyltransferase [Pilimelia anulata]GGJ87709.1 hypothetical protein GCM10010123_16610 [Pilimelia anulata]